MFPKALPIEPIKHHWYLEDSFTDAKFEYISAFIHKDYAIGMHTHSFYEINIVLGGTGCHYIGEQSFEINEGNIFIIPPDISHGYYNGGGLDVFHILIRNDFFYKYNNELEGIEGYSVLFEIEPYLRGENNEKLFLSLVSNEMACVQHYLDFLLVCESGNYPGKEIAENVTTLNLICYLSFLMHFRKNSNISLVKKQYSNYIIRCMEYIHENYAEKITIDTLTKISKMSRSSFIRNFNITCNCTPIEYVTNYRLRKANEMMKNTNVKITSIAQECGFYDVSHLKKAIRQKES